MPRGKHRRRAGQRSRVGAALHVVSEAERVDRLRVKRSEAEAALERIIAAGERHQRAYGAVLAATETERAVLRGRLDVLVPEVRGLEARMGELRAEADHDLGRIVPAGERPMEDLVAQGKALGVIDENVVGVASNPRHLQGLTDQQVAVLARRRRGFL